MLSLSYYENYTSKFRGLITFEPLELKQSYIPHLKVLVGGINTLVLNGVAAFLEYAISV